MITAATLLMFPAVVYLVFLWWLAFKLQKGLKAGTAGGYEPTSVSVLIAARNESGTIRRLIKSLAAGHFQPNRFRVILADDHSSDQTTAWAQDEAARQRINLTVCHPEKHGKRAALDEALSKTTDPWLAFTDADVTVNPGWLFQMTASTARKKIVMVLGRVDMDPTGGWFAKMQAAEYQSIAAMTAATAVAGMPVMANGASMLVRSDIYKQAVASGFQRGHRSGDDMFLLQFIKRHHGSKAIAFQSATEGSVVIDPEPTFGSFLRQRLRWVSKAGGYTDPAIITVSLLVALVGLSILCSMVVALLTPGFWWITASLYGLKTLADAPLLLIWSGHVRTRRLITSWFLPLQLLYPFYSVGVAVAGKLIRTAWH